MTAAAHGVTVVLHIVAAVLIALGLLAALAIARRRWPNRCPHSNLIPLHGDHVNEVGGWRLRCSDCHLLLDGPVTLAAARAGERDLYDGRVFIAPLGDDRG